MVRGSIGRPPRADAFLGGDGAINLFRVNDKNGDGEINFFVDAGHVFEAKENANCALLFFNRAIEAITKQMCVCVGNSQSAVRR